MVRISDLQHGKIAQTEFRAGRLGGTSLALASRGVYKQLVEQSSELPSWLLDIQRTGVLSLLS